MVERPNFSGGSKYPVGEVYTRHLLEEISTAPHIETVVTQIKNDKALGILSDTAAKILLTLCEPKVGDGRQKIFVPLEI